VHEHGEDAAVAVLAFDPGKGAGIHDAGRVVFDTPFHVSFKAGHQEVLHGDIDQLVCTALAAP
jgi:hypothetical protein